VADAVVCDPYVTVEAHGGLFSGVGTAGRTNAAHGSRWESSEVKGNGLSPHWTNEACEIVASHEALTQAVFTLCYRHRSAERLLAVAAVPLHAVRAGVRCLTMREPKHGVRLRFCKLLVRVSIDRVDLLDVPHAIERCVARPNPRLPPIALPLRAAPAPSHPATRSCDAVRYTCPLLRPGLTPPPCLASAMSAESHAPTLSNARFLEATGASLSLRSRRVVLLAVVQHLTAPTVRPPWPRACGRVASSRRRSHSSDALLRTQSCASRASPQYLAPRACPA
jgi:hypothetical protein